MIKVLNLPEKDKEILGQAVDILENIEEFADGETIGIDDENLFAIFDMLHGMAENIFELIYNLT